MKEEVLVRNAQTADCVQKAEHPGYAYTKKTIVGKEDSPGIAVDIYEIPPGKAAVPYHYHMQNEEVFFILSGRGILKTPQGERAVATGDFLYFPNSEKGAHKLTNASDTEPLVYVDFDTRHDPEIAFYPESQKVGIFGENEQLLFPVSRQVEYYQGE